ncbi:MAG: hypothetical protein L0154_13175 [Chloroflexi bacterium]|nr:hypothetical protein [Chloroflexota bacterium]
MKQIVLAIYQTVTSGQSVVKQLENYGIPRQNIGIAREHKPATSRSLVTATVDEADVENIKEIMQDQNPEKLGTREYQWLIDGHSDEEFKPEEFAALDMT